MTSMGGFASGLSRVVKPLQAYKEREICQRDVCKCRDANKLFHSTLSSYTLYEIVKLISIVAVAGNCIGPYSQEPIT